MSFVLNLIAAASGTPRMNEELVGEVKRLLGISSAAVEWLCAGVACDISLPATCDAPSVRAAAWEAFGDMVDANVIPTAGRRKRLLVADMDSTIIEQECIDQLAEAAGVGDRIKAITERAMRGEIDFIPALKERVRLLGGLPASEVDRVLKERITLRPGGRTLVKTMRAHGASTALVSGGFSIFTRHIAVAVGFQHQRANELLFNGGKLTGEVAEPILGKDAKVEALEELRAGRGLASQDVIAVGDGANDIPMLKRAGLGVAFHAKPAVREAASAVVDHADLTALLYLQGYRLEEFVD